jgi:hypothetical protein
VKAVALVHLARGGQTAVAAYYNQAAQIVFLPVALDLGQRFVVAQRVGATGA